MHGLSGLGFVIFLSGGSRITSSLLSQVTLEKGLLRLELSDLGLLLSDLSLGLDSLKLGLLAL